MEEQGAVSKLITVGSASLADMEVPVPYSEPLLSIGCNVDKHDICGVCCDGGDNDTNFVCCSRSVEC